MTRALGEFELMVLFAVLRLDEDAYGARVMKEIEETTGKSVVSGAVYTGLDRLEARGLVSSRVGEPTPERGGRRRRYYRLEREGAEALAQSLGHIRSMSEGVEGRLAAWGVEVG